MCGPHYGRFLKHGDPLAGGRYYEPRPGCCTIEGCDREVVARGWCGKHYARWSAHGDPTILKTPPKKVYPPCSVKSCENTAGPGLRGWCESHYKRQRTYGDPEYVKPYQPGPWRTLFSGYVARSDPRHPNANGAGAVLQHAHVMSEHLGRPLRKGEAVHHKNGIRHDNRLENLELWKSAHPPGQRVTELLAWAHALIEEYADDPQLWPEGLMP